MEAPVRGPPKQQETGVWAAQGADFQRRAGQGDSPYPHEHLEGQE